MLHTEGQHHFHFKKLHTGHIKAHVVAADASTFVCLSVCLCRCVDVFPGKKKDLCYVDFRPYCVHYLYSRHSNSRSTSKRVTQ